MPSLFALFSMTTPFLHTLKSLKMPRSESIGTRRA